MKDKNQKQLFGEKVITSHEEFIDNEQIQVFVTLNKDKDYYNVYLFNELYKDGKLNSLDLQTPAEVIENPETYFNKGFMISRIMEYIIWDRFKKYGTATVSLNIDFEEE